MQLKLFFPFFSAPSQALGIDFNDEDNTVDEAELRSQIEQLDQLLDSPTSRPHAASNCSPLVSPEVNALGHQHKGVLKPHKNHSSTIFLRLIEKEDFHERAERMPDGPFDPSVIAASGVLNSPDTTAQSTSDIPSPTAGMQALCDEYRSYPLPTKSDNLRPKDRGDNWKCAKAKNLQKMADMKAQTKKKNQLNKMPRNESSDKSSNLHGQARRTRPKFLGQLEEETAKKEKKGLDKEVKKKEAAVRRKETSDKKKAVAAEAKEAKQIKVNLDLEKNAAD